MRAQACSTLVLLAGAVSQSLAAPHRPSLRPRQDGAPTVDLGYEIHTATVNSTGDYYIFSNIPYAEQPIGDLRFQQVSLPTGSSSTVNNGSTDLICYQAYPEWILELEAASYGVTTDEIAETLYSQPGQTESCLVLDVYVPAGVFDGNSTSKAPVLIWIHGGGFTSGSKTSVGNPAGIIARSNLNNNDGIIFVSINYRLGLFGWLGDGGITPNLGLYDQLVAFDWVQEYISLFGGDPDQVTVMGESAGGSSILHHITSYGGNSTAPPFHQAILQSPAFQININLTENFALTLSEASNLTSSAAVTSAAGLAALDAAALQQVNAAAVLGAPEGYFTYGPAPDGTYVPALPQVLLRDGRLHRDVAVVAAHNALEAAPFVSPAIATSADVAAQLARTFPAASDATRAYVLDVLYPAPAYASPFLRAVQIASDSSFSCATRFLALAAGNDTYNYLFSYPPGYHAEDTSYTFYNGDAGALVDGYPVDVDLAYALQDYIVGFTISGDPNGSPAGPALEFPKYGSNATVLEFASTGLLTTRDDMDNDRCPWWQEAMAEGLV